MHFRKVSSKIINSKLLSFKINLNGKLSYLDWCFFIAKGQSVSSQDLKPTVTHLKWTSLCK